LSFSADIHLNVLNNSYDRVYLGDGHFMKVSPWARLDRTGDGCGIDWTHEEALAVAGVLKEAGATWLEECFRRDPSSQIPTPRNCSWDPIHIFYCKSL
jgi:hypothetical protein